MNLARGLSCLLVCSLLCAGSAHAQNLLTNGSFENPVVGTGTASIVPSIPGWTSTGGFEVWNQFQGPGADGNQYLELDVSTCTTISQTITTSTANNYLVSLAFAARNGVADNRIEVLWNGTVIGNASANGSGHNGNVVWTNYTFPVQVGTAGSSTLQIRNVDTCDGLGSLLDNVSVVAVAPPTSAPMFGRWGFALLAGGLVLLALVLHRRRAA